MTNALTLLMRLLWISCPAIAFAVMFGHMTGVINTGLALTGLAVLAAAVSRRRPSARWPLVAPIATWAAWSLGAVAWSAFPALSWHAWFDEVVYPLVTFWGFWLFSGRVGRPVCAAYACWAACLLLAIMSAVYLGHLQPPTPETFPLHYYARVGHTSTLALFAIPVFTGFMASGRARPLALAGIVLCVFIGFATLNRFFWPAVAVTLFIAGFPFYRRRFVHALAVFLGLSAIGAALAIYGGVLRFGEMAPPAAPALPSAAVQPRDVPPSFVAFDDAVRSDTRPKLWAFYGHEALHHAWRGVGFGKPLPGLALRGDMPAELLALEPQAPTHAHNLFLNTWLQTGVVGVVLQSALLVTLALRYWRLRRAAPYIAAAGVALVVGMVTKNFTDDFMWKTTMLAFWAFAGLLLGAGERAAPSPALPSQAAADSPATK